MFEHFSLCPLDLAWDAFGEKNGVVSLPEMRTRLARYRRSVPDPRENYNIGCVILRDPFFFTRAQWIPTPPDFAKNVVQGKTYDATVGTGHLLWDAVQDRLRSDTERFAAREIEGAVWGDPRLVKQRLGQGAFRVVVTDVYERRCAVTREKALPVLQAAHIRPVSEHGTHRVDNGLLLRSDVHTLFDRGYITVTPARTVRVSSHLKKDFDNGQHYYQLEGTEIWVPKRVDERPNRDFLEWHSDTVFRA